jgi:Protein of unknown function (DUF1822)
MSTYPEQLQASIDNYPEHIWINIDIDRSDISLSQSELNLLCIKTLRKYLTESLQLVVETTFPSDENNLVFVNKLVNGFALSISGIKVAFIPSCDLDLMGFEVPQEWVQLSNWCADYYVPIQIDLEHNCLHLWGFISDQYLQQRAIFDRTFRSYEVEGGDLINDLESLWMACAAVANRELTPERGKITSLPVLSPPDAQILIDRLQQHKSVFSPRLALPFEQWGAIINSPEYLNLYANPTPALVKISNWFTETIDNISTKIVDEIWQTIPDFCYQPAPVTGFMTADAPILADKFTLKGIPLSTDAEIRLAVRNLYQSQNPGNKVNLPVNIDSPILLLIYLIHHTTDQTLRWTAAEYLWTIQPDSDRNWHRRIRDLSIVIKGHKLGLMVAAIPLIDGTYAILNRVYSIESQSLLPANVQLELLSETGEQLYQTDSSSTTKYNYIQLYFIAGVGDRFNIRVSLSPAESSTKNVASITEAFVI